MPDLSNHLVIGISSSALFDTRESHRVYMDSDKPTYVQYQIDHEDEPFAPGPGFDLIHAMLRLNAKSRPHPIEVVVMSQNEPAAGRRVMKSIEYHKLGITRAAFTGGEPVWKYLKAFNGSLFLSRDQGDVRGALENGFAAGLIYDAPKRKDIDKKQLRIAFDGDAVIFSDASERIYKAEGLEAFKEHERLNASKAMEHGPFYPFLKMLADIQADALDENPIPIHTAIVTARDRPSDDRVFFTLREWGIQVNSLFFLGGIDKKEILEAYRPHIFFDDQKKYVQSASSSVVAAEVPTDYITKPNRVKQMDLAGQFQGGDHKKSEPVAPISKSEFEKSARRIFKQYLPRGNRILPEYQRAFIEKYKDADFEKDRPLVLRKLLKYDLATGARPVKIEFNRTKEEFGSKKLNSLRNS